MHKPNTFEKLEIQHGSCINLSVRVRVLVLNATFNNISVISWRSVLSVKETGVLQITDKHDHIMLHRVHLMLVAI